MYIYVCVYMYNVIFLFLLRVILKSTQLFLQQFSYLYSAE